MARVIAVSNAMQMVWHYRFNPECHELVFVEKTFT